jgi:Nucleoside-diphosphate-sugar pyrophosphorylase involved in lipopolysaccharide biosynthesis/translation initiation factor 2B, gamma/epsilon subunits (eIF-2Bgamma/eIF-2Bepsilon)
MKAVVLAGGYATRLWPITKNRPKMFLPVGERTVIDEILVDLEDDPRVEDVYVSTNERFADKFDEYLSESDFDKPQLSVENTQTETEKFGVVGALTQLVNREEIADDLLVVAGDNLISFHLSEFIDFFESTGTASLAAYDVGSRERAKSYGLVELDGTRVVDFQEKPENPQSTLVSIACYAFTADQLPLLDRYLTSDNNPDEPGWLIQWLQERDPIHAFSFDDAWFDIGTPESYLSAVKWSLDGECIVHEDAELHNTVLGENVQIMAGAEVIDSTVDNSVVFPDVTIQNADIRQSIIDRSTRLEDLDFAGALIGAHTTIANGSSEQ